MCLTTAESLEMLYCGLEVPHADWIGGGRILLDPVQEWEPTKADEPEMTADDARRVLDGRLTTADDLGLRPDVSQRVLTEARRRLTTEDVPPTTADDGQRPPRRGKTRGDVVLPPGDLGGS